MNFNKHKNIMEIKELVEKELNKIKSGEFANLDNVKLTSDLGKDIMINIIKNLTVMHSSLKLNDKIDRLSELGNNLIKEIEKKIPFIQLPQDEDLYMALHKLKQEIKDSV